MEITLGISALLTLCATIALLGAAPSASSVLVISSTVAHGRGHGIAAAAGIAAADALFALAALVGLSAMLATLPDLFAAVQILCGLALAWMAFGIWRSRNPANEGVPAHAARWRNFVSGMTITFADQKAVLFYLALMPAYLDMSVLSAADVALAVCVVGVSVFLPKAAYAVLAEKGAGLMTETRSKGLKAAAAVVLWIASIYLLVSGVHSALNR